MTMKLFRLQPDGHGPTSYFVMATAAEEAANAINKERRRFSKEQHGGYMSDGWGDEDVRPEWLVEAAHLEVITNDNA